MPRYLETAEQLRQEVEDFRDRYLSTEPDEKAAMVELGHIINLAIRCSPRGVQHTVRKNIVAAAMRDYCNVTMTKGEDPKTGYEFNKIHIMAKD